MPAGFIEGKSDFSARNGFVVSDITEVKKAIDWYAAARLSTDQDL